MTKTHLHPDNAINPDNCLEMITALCAKRGERMTKVRRDVILALAHLDKAYPAYQILSGINKKRTPLLSAMSLYRTLDFLIELGVAVKFDSQNAYKLCADHPHAHSHLMIICDNCGSTEEIDDPATTTKLENLAKKHSHILKHHVIELHGTCSSCSS